MANKCPSEGVFKAVFSKSPFCTCIVCTYGHATYQSRLLYSASKSRRKKLAVDFAVNLLIAVECTLVKCHYCYQFLSYHFRGEHNLLVIAVKYIFHSCYSNNYPLMKPLD